MLLMLKALQICKIYYSHLVFGIPEKQYPELGTQDLQPHI